MATIKLLEAGKFQDGTRRFHTRLTYGKQVFNFIMGKDNIMMHYDHRDSGGYGFYPYQEEYEIVHRKKDLKTQKL